MKKILLYVGGIVGGLFVIIASALAIFPSILLMELHASSHEPPPAVASDLTDDDYWTVKQIAPNVYAIGELDWYQKNWHFLIFPERGFLLISARIKESRLLPNPLR